MNGEGSRSRGNARSTTGRKMARVGEAAGLSGWADADRRKASLCLGVGKRLKGVSYNTMTGALARERR